MTRVIVHTGFHKTGTSSLQSYLHDNRKLLRPHFRFYGKANFLAAGSAARIYGQKPYPWRLRAFRHRFDGFLAQIDDDPVIVLSRETFSGAMPGHRRLFGRQVRNYARAAVPLGQEIIAALQARFGPDVDITFLFTLREKEAWIRSVYGHLLRSIHLRDDYAAFRKRFPRLIDLEEEAHRIMARLPVDQYHMIRLEDYANTPQGPATGLLEYLGVPLDGLPPARRANVGQSKELEAQFLAMNRTSRDKAALKREKDRLLAATAADPSQP